MRALVLPVALLGAVLTTATVDAAEEEPAAATSGFEILGAGPDTMEIRNQRSGKVCRNGPITSAVCEDGREVVIAGEDTCDWSEGVTYPCTRTGHEFDYVVADPAEPVRCEVTRSVPTLFDPDTEQITGERTAEYSIELDSATGHLFHHGFAIYTAVAERTTIHEQHLCSRAGVPLYQVDFTLIYEPES